MRVLAVGSDSVGHLSHAAVLLGALARRHDVESSVVVPHDARFGDWIAARGFALREVGRVMGVHREFSAPSGTVRIPAYGACWWMGMG